MELVFATNNQNKINEIEQMLDGKIKILGLKDIGCNEDIPETSDTIEGNAIQKAKYVYENYGYNCFADDTGLLINELNGEPGVYSARYAGPEKDSEKNMDLVLSKLENVENRSANFTTVISLIIDGKISCFEGKVHGAITKQKSGCEGFGYDPIFQPEGYNCTFSEMSLEEKNNISHRGKAVSNLIHFLNNN